MTMKLTRGDVYRKVDWPAGTTSEAIPLQDCVLAGVIFPATFSGTAVTFTGSHDGVTFTAINDANGAVSMTMVQAKAYKLPADVMAFPWIKMVGTSQGSDRILYVTRKN